MLTPEEDHILSVLKSYFVFMYLLFYFLSQLMDCYFIYFFVVFDWCYLFNLCFGLNNKNKK